ncbi:MAG: tape measure protein [Candidatus Thorarchaeota archaeon]
MPTPLVLKIEVDDRGSVKVDKVVGSFDRLKDATKKADGKVKDFSHTMGTVRGVLGGVTKAVFSLKGALAALGLGYLAKSAIGVAARFEQVQVALDTITKGKGVETFKALNLWALRMPVNTERAIEAFQMMIAMGLKPSIKDMTTLVDTMAALGGSEDIMTSIALALGKIQAKGGATARELLMLTRRGIPAVQILREELKDTSIGFENIATSSYNANQIITALLTGLEKRYGGLSERIHHIWVGLMETIVSEYKEFVRVVFASGVMEYLESKIQKFIDQIDIWRASGQLDVWAKNVANVLIGAFQKIERAIVWVIDHIDDLKKAFKLLLIPVKAFIAFKLAAILTEIGDGAVFAVKKIIHLRSSMELLNTKMSKLSPGTKGGLIGLALFGGWEIGKWLNQFNIVKKWGIALAAGLHKTFLWLEKSLKGTWDLIKFAFDKMVQGIEKTLNALPESIQFVLNSIIDGINKLLDSMSKLPIIGKKIQGAKLGKIEFGTIKLKEDYMTFEEVLQNLLKYESDYEKALKDAKKIWQEMFDEVGKVEESTNEIVQTAKEVPKVELPDLGGEAEIEITEMMAAWNKLWEDMNEGFVQGFADMLSGNIRKFSDFMKSLKNIFIQGIAKMASEQFIRPIIEPITGLLKNTFSGIFGGIFGGKDGKSIFGEGLLGGMTGAVALGGIGTMISNFVDRFTREKPSIELKWSIDKDEFQQIADSWKGGAEKNEALIGTVNDTIGNLVKMYSKMSNFVNIDMAKMEITMNNIYKISRDMASIPYQFAAANIDILEKMFGEAVATDLMSQIEEVQAEIKRVQEEGFRLAGIAGAFGGKNIAIATIFGTRKNVEELEDELKILYDALSGNIEELFNKFESFFEEFSDIIGKSFLESLETKEFQSFKDGLRKGIYDSFRTALLIEFQKQTLEQIMPNLWQSFGITGWGDVVNMAMQGDSSQALAMIETMTAAIDQIEPAFNILTDVIIQMENALNLNTEAIVSNNNLLEKQQMVEDFISELTTGGLAPVQSYEAIMGRYQDLLASDNLQELFNFVTGTALPFLQTYGGNYQEAFSGVIEDLRNLSGLYGANISPSAIGEAVAGAIMPALQGGSQTIHVTVEVDGREIGEILLDQLQTNPQLVQEIKEIAQ